MAPRQVLCVAEKPSIAKDLAAMLSRNTAQSHRTYSQYNAKFEFSYTFEGQPCNFVMTSVLGHLFATDFVESNRKWHAIEPIDLLKMDTAVIKFVPDDKKDLEKTLKEEARKASALICFLDGDREGENISFEVIETCRTANPRIQVKRAHFSAVIQQEIDRAMRTLVAPDKNLSDAVDARIEIDLRLGAAFTRFQTLTFAKQFGQLENKLLSWGPCQFATLGFIVDRDWKIERFVQEDFWSVTLKLKADDGSGTAVFEWERGRLFDQTLCASLYEEMLESPEAIVTNVREHIKRKWKPKPLATVELQTLASRKLRMSSERTMTIAEELYNQGILSYPRTETEVFKEGTDLRELISKQIYSREWGAFADMLLNQGGFEWPKPGKNDDNAHPPIHPTAWAPDLDGDKKKLYELVVRHFLACCSKDAIGAETVIDAEIAEERFVCKGLMIKETNYLDVYIYDKWSNNSVPLFVQGEAFQPTELTMTSGRTQAPPLLSEADLIQMMNRYGIGTDATIATHITTVQHREYAVRNDATQQFSPTQLGKSLVTGYEHLGIELARPQFRSKMEQDMKDIALGRQNKHQVVSTWMAIMTPVLKTCAEKSRQIIGQMERFFQPVSSASWVDVVQRNFSKCGECDGHMNLKKRMGGQRNGDSMEQRALLCQRCDLPHQVPEGQLSACDIFCPICNFQVLQVTKADTGRQHHVCPKCFNSPPDGVGSTGGKMRCFQCADPRCKLALGVSGVPIRPCTENCGQQMILKRTQDRNFRLACQGMPHCKATIYLPGGCHVNITPVTPERFCSICQSPAPIRLLKFQFKRGSVQAHIPLMMEACVGGCNRDLKEMLQDMNSARIHDRLFFSQGPPSVAIHSGVGGRAGSVGGGGSGRGGGDGGGGSGVRNVHNGNQAVGGRQALGLISSGSSRVNGADDDFAAQDIEDVNVIQKLDSFLNTADSNPSTSFGPNGGRGGGRGLGMGRGGFGGGGADGSGSSKGVGRGMGEGRGGFGGVGADGGGANRGVCFKCGEPGHFAPACPSKGGQGEIEVAEEVDMGGGGGGGGGGSADAEGKRVGTCYICQQEGHWANNCPNKGVGRGQGGAGARGAFGAGSRGGGAGGSKSGRGVGKKKK